MEIFIAGDYKEMSKQSADAVITLVQPKRKVLLCTASGDTPAGLYDALVHKIKEDKTDISGWRFVGLDEWTGMNGADEGSCRYYIDKQLFEPLQVPPDNIRFFDGKAKDLQNECKEVETFISQYGGIDVAILGLGMNGHIGMNEPGISGALFSHVTAIDPLTAKTGQKYFRQPTQLTGGVTLGLATIMRARNIILLVSGRHKAAIVKRVLHEEVSEHLPASILRDHPAVKIYLDKDAASMIDLV